MELKFVIPNMAKSLGNLEFGGPAEVDGAAGQKQFAYMEPVKLKNPSVTAEGYVINGRAFVDYILHAEDMEKA